ncbi:tRNA/tmRNA/rRNA uracil-C5-methylase (TrmA/RlmC/RlmD family) [Agromyces terreus]|uniref:tRNA/tmRNA/rRNA uracil-C5-methylase (TrmA/RlmC/RlmD family) n=1 Tax=Agromyces terreus TaxID=424795 RepID=A0A9X2H295_9MICO|nr:TRAM domain-containing protein [Agromyces terreus]MCP2371268.1 tRNA/tmRNA/rRNA uracil-C5-methylase (TrmA/RlmC/RlmD family) [Agromyces terreus]
MPRPPRSDRPNHARRGGRPARRPNAAEQAGAPAPKGSARGRAPAPIRTDGPVLELEVERIAHGGIAVAHHEGRVVFVADAIPGERVRARVSDTAHERFWRADTVEVLEASADRREHVWAEASVDRAPERRAGGAEFGHIADERQRALKAEVLRDALSRFGGVERDVVVQAVDPALAPGARADGTGWRTRVRLHVAADGAVGPYAARSHTVVPVASVPLAVDELAALAPLSERFPGAVSIDLVAPSGADPQLVVSDGERMPRGERPVTSEVVGDRRFTVDRDGFWQVHRGAAATLTKAVQAAVDADRFDPRAANLDLYGGVGLLAAAIGDRFGDTVRITSVESDERATGHAGANLADWVGARALTARVDRFLAELEADASAGERARLREATVVLDPPRSGAGRDVVDRLAALRPAQLVYVACDPVALARDVGLLRRQGYELEHLEAFDLFPNTHHVEAVARLAAIV